METLFLKDRTAFNKAVWSADYDFTKATYTDWLKGTVAAMQRIYNELDGDNTLRVQDADLYRLGDAINLLDHIEIDPEYNTNLWGVYPDNFEEYMTEGLDYDEMKQLINDTAQAIFNDEDMSEPFWEHIRQSAKAHGLSSRDEIIEETTKTLFDMDCNMKYAMCQIAYKDGGRADVIIAIEDNEETRKHDKQIFFYCTDRFDFLRLCYDSTHNQSREDFIIISTPHFTNEI